MNRLSFHVEYKLPRSKKWKKLAGESRSFDVVDRLMRRGIKHWEPGTRMRVVMTRTIALPGVVRAPRKPKEK